MDSRSTSVLLRKVRERLEVQTYNLLKLTYTFVC